MIEFDTIHVVWRKGPGGGRHCIGTLKKLPDGKHEFTYVPNAEQLRKDYGFTPYTEFQDLNKVYNSNVAEIFGQRLTKIDRPDIDAFFKFWEVDPQKANDKFYLLGKTQGLVATDNFEFLAEYHLTAHTHFLTEIASLSINPLPKGAVSEGDQLRFELDRENEHDRFAVKVFKGDLSVGYIKKYHNKIFYEENANALKLVTKAVEQNGVIKRMFIKVYI